MRAVVMRSYGEPPVLREEIVPDPAGLPGNVLVRLEAAALNWHDVLVRRGQYASPLPHVPGADGAGRRVDTGERVISDIARLSSQATARHSSPAILPGAMPPGGRP